jgi:hypothetical protein
MNRQRVTLVGILGLTVAVGFGLSVSDLWLGTLASLLVVLLEGE